jgi:hypothetical protein
MTQALTVQSAERHHIRPNREPTAADFLRDLESSPLGLKLLELLQLAGEIDTKAAKREGDHVSNFRRYLFRSTPEELVAEQILNRLGNHEDCFLLREIAQDAAERVLEAAE